MPKHEALPRAAVRPCREDVGRCIPERTTDRFYGILYLATEVRFRRMAGRFLSLGNCTERPDATSRLPSDIPLDE